MIVTILAIIGTIAFIVLLIYMGAWFDNYIYRPQMRKLGKEPTKGNPWVDCWKEWWCLDNREELFPYST